VTLPIVVVLALLIGTTGGSDKSPKALPALTPSAPPSSAAATAPCTKLLQNLPVRLESLAPRTVHPVPDTPFVVAWGDPAVIVRCGVARPKDLHPGSTAQFQGFGDSSGKGTVYFDVTSSGSDEIYTSVDRAVYVEITLPSKYPGSTYVTDLAAAIAKAMPAVCIGGQPGAGSLPPTDQLCSRRP
jgi:hypothetical protein